MHKISVLFISLAILGACQQKQTETTTAPTVIDEVNYQKPPATQTTPQNWVGHIDFQYAISLQAETEGNSWKGTYQYLNQAKPIRLEGQKTAEGLDLQEFAPDNQVIGKMALTAEGTNWQGKWNLVAKPDQLLPVRLFASPTVAEQTPIFKKLGTTITAPEELVKQAQSLQDTTAFYNFLISNNLVQGDQLKVFTLTGEEAKISPNENFSIAVEYQNLFGDAQKEAIVAVRWGREVSFLTFFYQKDNNWQQVNGIVGFNAGMPENFACVGTDDSTFFAYEWAEIRQQGEFCLKGRINRGYCGNGAGRGSDIEAAIWQITEKGVFKVFSTTQYRYEYSSPSPEPTNEVIDRELSIEKTANFPKKITLTDQLTEKVYEGEKKSENFRETKIAREVQIPILLGWVQ